MDDSFREYTYPIISSGIRVLERKISGREMSVTISGKHCQPRNTGLYICEKKELMGFIIDYGIEIFIVVILRPFPTRNDGVARPSFSS
jgi:hypothetical protein